MKMINFNDKCFKLLRNSHEGESSADTVFRYKQEGKVVTAEYSGGSIIEGKIVAKLIDDQLDMRYVCLTTEGELRSGSAIANISLDTLGKMMLHLDWQWYDLEENGKSVYQEM